MAHFHYSPLVLEDYHQTFQSLLEGIREGLDGREIIVSDEFVMMIVKLSSLDPANKFLIKQQMVQSELDRMQKIVIERIISMSTMSRNIIAMQLHHRIYYYTRDDSIEAHREFQEMSIGSLMDEMKTGVPKHVRHYDLWYAKLIGATIIEADMGPATESSVVRETEAALTTVFPKDDINLLQTMSEKERVLQLYRLIHITIGIRLHSKNKDPEGYGAFIVELPKVIPEKIEEGLMLMAEMRDQNIQRLIKYTTLIQPYFLRHLAFKMGRRNVSSDMVKIRQGLVMVHQILIYFKELSDDLNREKEISQHLIASYGEILKELHKIVHKSKSAQTSLVYPKYVALYESWRDLQDAGVFVDSVQGLTSDLINFTDIDLKETDALVDELLGPKTRIPSPNEFFNFPNINLPDDKYALAKRLDFRDDLSPLQMNYSGFCMHSLVKGVGLVVLSNPQIGIFNWKNQNFLVSTAKGAIDFRRDPDSFIQRSQAIARRWPELIYLLNIEKEAFDPGTVSDSDRSKKTTNILISTDMDAQTELHPVSSRVVEHYTWNEWELRNRGLILSKIHNCKTHSTQTHTQALKVNADVQTYSTKTSFVQTNKSVHTEAPLSQFYLYGLRGLHCDVPPHVVEMTRENPTDLKCITSTKKEPELQIEGGNPTHPPDV